MNEYLDDLLKLASIGFAALSKAATEGISEEDFIDYLGQDINQVKLAIEENLLNMDKEAEHADPVDAAEDVAPLDSSAPESESVSEMPMERDADVNDSDLIKQAALEILNQSNEAQRKALDLLKMLNAL